MRATVIVLGATLLAHAPLQCSREPEPDLQRYETPPDALYDLATRFKARGEQRAYRDTLSYLVERYPSSRFAIRAKDELGATDAGTGTTVGTGTHATAGAHVGAGTNTGAGMSAGTSTKPR